MLEIFANLTLSWFDPSLILLTAMGTLAGIYVGAIPGLSVTMATSILISFTFRWEVNEALALIAGVFVGGVYGGSRTAILLNIPGAPSAIATAIEGYPMAKRGEAGEAIGLTTVMSVIGGFIGIIALALFAPLIASFAIQFNSRDYMLLGLIGILLVGSLSGESFAKGAFAGALGVLIGMSIQSWFLTEAVGGALLYRRGAAAAAVITGVRFFFSSRRRHTRFLPVSWADDACGTVARMGA